MRTGTAFVGRERELTELRHALDEPPALVVVVGPFGVGKTALVERALALRADERVVRGRADELDRSEFGLWRGLLRRLHSPWPAASSLSPEEQRWDVLDIVSAALSRSRADVVFIDDVHWADESSLWLLDHLVDPAADAATSWVVASRRPVETSGSRWASLCRRATQLPLDGLRVDEVRALVELLDAAPAAGDLHDLTGGNPLLIGEVVRHGVAGSTVADLLRSALTSPGVEVAEVVAALCVAGADTPLAWLADALGRDLSSLEADLAVALRSDLLHQVDESLRPRHHLLADTAREWFGQERSRRLHHALAHAWQQRPGATAALAAARHALAALPDPEALPGPEALPDARPRTDPALDGALRAVERAVDAARADGLTASAADLLCEARTAAEAHRADAVLVARLALDEAEARWALHDIDAAFAAAANAATAAERSGDASLIGAAELLVLRHHNPFAPDPLRIAQLADIESRLAEHGDLALRAQLRGRRAVLSFSLPHAARDALALADDAVALARRSTQPEVLIDALRDRYFVLPTPADFDGRADAAAEILELARRHGRPQLSLLGLEWAFAGALGRGDVTAATDALDRLETLATVMASPVWRYAALVRRAGLAALDGDPDRALALADAALAAGPAAVPTPELLGVDLAIRFGVAELYRREPTGLAHPLAAMTAALNDVPLLFAQVMLATYELQTGDRASARRRLTPWNARFASALTGPEGLGILALAARATTRLGWRDPATELIDLLQPFTGRLDNPGGVGTTRPVDLTLAELHLLNGTTAAALGHAHAAVDLARRRGLAALLPECLDTLATASARASDPTAAALARDAAEAAAEPLGITLPVHAAAAPPTAPDQRNAQPSSEARTARLRLTNATWTITSSHGETHLPDSTSARQLIRLLVTPNTEIPAVELAGGATGNHAARANDLGPVLDQRAKQHYRRRITELRADIDDAEAGNDIERAARYRIELDALLDQLRAAVGLAGRDRPQQSGAEKARINVTRNIRRAIAAIAATQPALGAHLQNSVRTGHVCAYNPEPAAAITWHTETA